MSRFLYYTTILALTCQWSESARSIEILVDYSYDTRDFFADPVRREAIEAVAGRYSRVITSELAAVEPILDLGRPTTWRVGFDHPGTGEALELSTATNYESDPIGQAGGPRANEYGFAGLEADQWILFVGGRPLNSAGIGGTGSGTNFTTVFDALVGPMHRGLVANIGDNTAADLPTWGGAVAFNEDLPWHFDLESNGTNGSVDFYSLAMHEVAHALGLSTTWNQWVQHIDGSSYTGSNSIDALNADNGTSYSAINLTGDSHWAEETYQSRIFQPGLPNTYGTVGDGLQDLLLEPIANFSSSQRRIELTNVDVAALVDVGWAVLEESNSLDLNGDGEVGGADVDLACTAGSDLSAYYAELNTTLADVDFDREVGFSDFLIMSGNFGAEPATYSMADINCNGSVGFEDFLILSTEFGTTIGAASVPEPELSCLCLLVILTWSMSARNPRPVFCRLVSGN